jgi:hypothetical protein
MRHSAARLRDYRVADIHDPRLNVQSIQARHFLLEALFGDRFVGLREQELRFALVAGWWLDLLKSAPDAEQLDAVGHALKHQADNAEGLPIPPHVRRAFADLPCAIEGAAVPNYLGQFLHSARSDQGRGKADDATLDLFLALWREVLGRECPPRVSVVEAACGSANDYRAWEACGLARLVDYTGFDLCEKNVANARAMFPQARFQVGNVFELAYPDKSFDLCVAQDLLEHLSLAGLERAVAELCRVTRRALCLGFFQMHEGPEHVVRPVDEYHFNTLSLPQVRALFARHGGTAQAIHVNTFLTHCFACVDGYYDTAYTLIVRF